MGADISPIVNGSVSEHENTHLMRFHHRSLQAGSYYMLRWRPKSTSITRRDINYVA